MKSTLFSGIFLLFLIGLGSCAKDKCEVTVTYTKYTPIYKPKSELLKMEVKPAESIHNKGRIWLYGSYLLVNEDRKGIHVFDNSNPSSPQALCFIDIPGNTNMAVKNNVLFANNYTDLLSIDFSNPAAPHLVTRTENAFDNITALNDQLLTGFDEELVTEKVDQDCGSQRGWRFSSMEKGATLDSGGGSGAGGGNPADDSGKPNMGGSMSRFSMVGNYLYIVDESDLTPVKISNPLAPVVMPKKSVGWDIETLFAAKGKLFIGSMSGMYIFGLDDPASPNKLSMFQHARSCDPVVVSGDIAYVTLRGGTRCGGFTNQLDVLDVKDVMAPKLLKSYPLTGPLGLGIDNKKLFICDGSDGLKVYDAIDPMTIDQHQIGHYPAVGTYDVIPYQGRLIMITETGIQQYDYSDPKNLKLLSTIPIVK